MSRRFTYYNAPSAYPPYTLDFIAATGLADAAIIGAMADLENEITGYGLIDYSNPSTNKFIRITFYNLGSAGLVKYNFLDPRDLDAAFRVTPNGGITYASTGVTGNGINGFFDTHLIPNDELSIDDASYGMYIRTNTANVNRNIGCFSAGSNMFTYPRYTDNKTYVDFQANEKSVANTSSLGLIQTSKNAAGNLDICIRGTVSSFSVVDQASLPINPHYDGAVTGPSDYDDREFALAYNGRGLTPTQMQNWDTAVVNYMTTLGIQV